MKKNILILVIIICAVFKVTAQSPFIYQYKNKSDKNVLLKKTIKNKIVEFVKNEKKDSVDCEKAELFLTQKNYAPLKAFNKKMMDSTEFTNLLNSENWDDFSFVDRKKILDSLKASSKVKSTTREQLEVIDSIRQELKNYNTTNEFLNNKSKPEAFSIFKSRYFNIDTINTYLSGQSGLSTFQNIALQNFNEATTISAEFANTYFGAVRLGLSGNFTTKNDTAKDIAIKKNLQSIMANGGIMSLNFSLPICLTRDKDDKRHFGLFLQNNIGINPGFDSTSKRTDLSSNILFNNQTGVNFHFDITSNDKKARLFFDLPFYYVWGSQKTYEQLGISDYSILKMQAGLVFNNKVAFKISGPLLSSSSTIQGLPYLITFNFSPSNL